jgi:hypothetical protein
MAVSVQSAIDAEKLNAFVGRMLGDLGALTNAVLVHVGDQLGFYKAMTRSGPMDSGALAKQTGTFGTAGARMVVGAGSARLCHL